MLNFQEDIPNEDWLQEQIDYARERGLDRFGVPYMGKMTGSFEGHITVSLEVLSKLKGQRREQETVRHLDLAAIKQVMHETGKLPLTNSGQEYVPFVVVAHDGSAWINEGNHRIMAAAELGWKALPVELRYFDGGQRIESGPMHLQKLMMQSDQPERERQRL